MTGGYDEAFAAPGEPLEHGREIVHEGSCRGVGDGREPVGVCRGGSAAELGASVPMTRTDAARSAPAA